MPDCIIVGGGVIGLLTARQLFQQGVDVLLLEKGPLGGESSWAGGGIISPLYPWRYDESVNVLAERSKKLYPDFAQTLYQETGIDCELLNSGLFTVADESPEIIDWAKKWSIDYSYIDDKQAIRDIEKSAGRVVDRGIWMPGINQIRNPRLVKALKASLAYQGINYKEGVEVEEIIVEDGRVRGVRTSQQKYHADKVIVASGAWSAQFSATEETVDVIPVKGQMIMYKGVPGMVEHIVLSEGHYIIPRRDGRILAGSTLEKIGFDKNISEAAYEELHRSAAELVPLLDELPVERQWAGLRPGTEKGIPYICEHDEVDGLYIHAGHFRNGIVLGMASAVLMTDIVLERTPWCDAAPYTLKAPH